jgi:hypothetical protein
MISYPIDMTAVPRSFIGALASVPPFPWQGSIGSFHTCLLWVCLSATIHVICSGAATGRVFEAPAVHLKTQQM